MFKSKLRTLAVAGVMVASVVTLGAAGASSAFAGVQPSPSPTCPTPTPIRFSPTVSPTDHVRPEPCPTPTQPVVNPLNCNQRPPIRFAPTATPSDQISLSAKVTRVGGTPNPTPSYTHTPKPTPTPTETVPPPVVNPQCRAWTFDVDTSDIAGLTVNDVEGSGAIPMFRWINTQGSNPAIDTFSRGGNSVTLLHSLLPTPSVNLATCSVTFDQPNGRFVILRGTGTGARWVAFNGQFDLLGMVSYPSIRYRSNVLNCPLRFFSVLTILRAIENGTPVPGLPAPTFQDFSVQGSALLARR